MAFDLADFAVGMDPAERQLLVAELLRKRQGEEAIQQANRTATKFSRLAAVSQMANNEGVTNAAGLADKTQQARFKPIAMGQQGFMLPDSGQFVESPIYTEQKAADRNLRKEALLEKSKQAEAERQRKQEYTDQMLAFRQANLESLDALRQAQAGLASTRADRLLLGGTLSAMQQAAQEARAERERARQESAHAKDVNKLSTFLKSKEFPQLSSALDLVDRTLSAHPEGKLPGFGRFGSLVPSGLSGTDVQIIRTNMSEAANIILKARSGAAVTEPEARRFLTEVAMGKLMDEATLRNGWRNVMTTFGADVRNVLAGVTPEVYSTYVENGGEDLHRWVRAVAARTQQQNAAMRPQAQPQPQPQAQPQPQPQPQVPRISPRAASYL